MNMIEVAAIAFFVGNGVRIVAYIPQMVALIRCRGVASGFSMLSWLMFGAAHAVTAVYALIVLGDLNMTAIFAVNFLCCGIIVWLAVRCIRNGRADKARERAIADAAERLEDIRRERNVVPLNSARMSRAV